jgi:hypothetical protein
MGKSDMKAKFTQRMQMHLNGGSDYSVLCYEVLRDGKPTGITRNRATNGSPQYLLTSDVFQCGKDEFDVLKGGNLQEWLEAHSTPETPKGPE